MIKIVITFIALLFVVPFVNDFFKEQSVVDERSRTKAVQSEEKGTKLDPEAMDKLVKQFSDPGHVESKWQGYTFLLSIKIPPNPNIYLTGLCGIAADMYQLTNFQIELRKIGQPELLGKKKCR